MILSKFILIDAAFLIVGFSIVLFLQGKKTTPSLLGEFKDSISPDQILTSFPSLSELLELETLARTEGSGIEFDSLNGLWKFVSVWKQGTDQEDSMSSSLLRLFSASLELRKQKNNEQLSKFDITNCIRFVFLSISFIGSGQLTGSQPLLSFAFERIDLKLGNNVVLSRLIAVPDEKNRPFFALIAMGKTSQWLSARGRGGGLALWLKA